MSLYFPTADECTLKNIFPGVTIRTAACEKMMLGLATLQPHSVVEKHSHPHEQVGMVIEGKAIFIIGDEQKTVTKGDMYRIPGNTLHKVIALDETFVALDIFCPTREDYL